MDNYIKKLTTDLQEAVSTLQVVADNGLTDFDQAMLLASFFKTYQNTNTLVDYAMGVIASKENLEELKADAERMKQLADAFCHIYYNNKEKLDAIDANPLYEEHIKPFADREKAEQKIALPLWQEYSRLSNHLDYMDRDSDEFKQLDAECDRVKAEYDVHHAKVGVLHKEWHDEVTRCSCVAYLKADNLDVLCHRLSDIAASIINEVEIAERS